MKGPASTRWALLVGASIGGVSAIVTWNEPPAAGAARPSAPPAPVPIAAVAPSPATSSVSTVPGQARPNDSAPPTPLSSPHEQALDTARAVERAEIRCIEAKDGDACLRAADAHAAGNVVALDDKRAKRFASIARTHYINQCEAQSSLACQRLSLLYRAGEGVRQSTWTADRLLARSREHCHLRKNREFCAALDRP